MISLDIQGHRFQVRTAAVVLHEGFVLLHRGAGEKIWALPGGRVEPGEDARSALQREIAEELNEVVECDDLLYVAENFYESAGRPNHEIGFYFRVRFGPKSPMLDKQRSHAGVEGGHPLEFRWYATQRLSTVDLRPQFLQSALSQPSPTFQHVVQSG